MKISNLFKINTKKDTCVNEFYIGKNRFVIIEIETKKENVIYDKALSYLLTSKHDVLWFSSYYEMESNINYFLTRDVQFIIIG